MALIACKECTKEVSSEAPTCLNCGARLKTHIILKILLWWFGILFFMVFLSVLLPLIYQGVQ